MIVYHRRYEGEEQRQWRRQREREYYDPLFSCDIGPWIQELLTRMQEASAAGSPVVNLSYTHPRGFFPPRVMHRPAMRAAIKQAKEIGWRDFDLSQGPPVHFPNVFFLPAGWPPSAINDQTMDWCDLQPFIDEIELRQREAFAAGHWVDCGPDYGPKWTPGLTDLTGFHPRGEIHPNILWRIEQRRDPKWKNKMREEIEKLYGEANQDDGRAKTMEQKAEAYATKPSGPGDPTNLLSAAKEMRERAGQLRERARLLKKELGEA